MEPAGDVRPQPRPLPPAAPSARPARRGRTVAVVVCVVLALGACGVLSTLLVPALGRGAGSALRSRLQIPALRRGLRPPSAYWAGRGRYAAIQTTAEDGSAQVVVWRKDGETRAFSHVRVAAVEEASAAVWLVPDSVEATPDPYGVQRPTGTTDVPVDGVFRLRLDDPAATPRFAPNASWPRWRGAGSYAVELQVDSRVGAFPSALRFFDGVKPLADASLSPPARCSYRPLGWSPSGRYFAAVELVRQDTGNAGTVIAIFDLKARRTVTAYLGEVSLGSRVVWDHWSDQLWWLDDGYRPTTLRTLDMRGELHPRFEDSDGAWRDSGGWFVEGTEAGPVFFSGTGQLWRVFNGGPSAIGSVVSTADGAVGKPRSGTVDYDESAGVLSTMIYGVAGGAYQRSVLVGPPAGARRPIWTQRIANPASTFLGLDRLGRP